jgi:hypothetical protein
MNHEKREMAISPQAMLRLGREKKRDSIARVKKINFLQIKVKACMHSHSSYFYKSMSISYINIHACTIFQVHTFAAIQQVICICAHKIGSP